MAEEPDKLVLVETFVSDMHFSYKALLLTTSKVIQQNLAKKSTEQLLQKTRRHFTCTGTLNEQPQGVLFHFRSFTQSSFKIDITSQNPLILLLVGSPKLEVQNSGLIALSCLHTFSCKSVPSEIYVLFLSSLAPKSHTCTVIIANRL